MASIDGFPTDSRFYLVIGAANHAGLPRGRVSSFHQLILRPLDQAVSPNSRSHLVRVMVQPVFEGDLVVPVPTSFIGLFPIGSIIRRGSVVSTGPWQKRVLSPLPAGKITNDAAVFYPARPLFRSLPKRIAGDGSDARHDGNADFVRFEWQTQRICLPIYEILRAFFLFDHRIAMPLLREPWAVARTRLLQVEASNDGHGPVLTLAHSLPHTHAPFLYLFACDAEWSACMPLLFDKIVWNMTEPDGWIETGFPRMPFYIPERGLTIRGFTNPDDPDEFIALQVASFGWIGPGTLRVRRRHDGSHGTVEGGHPFALPQSEPGDGIEYPVVSGNWWKFSNGDLRVR